MKTTWNVAKLVTLHTLALIAALAATPAMACTDWKAIAAFDTIIAAHAEMEVDEMNRAFEKVLNAGNKLSNTQVNTSTAIYTERNRHAMEVEADRDAALADKCQENAR